MKSSSEARKQEEKDRKTEQKFQEDKKRILKVARKILEHPKLIETLKAFFNGHEAGIALLVAGTGPIDSARALAKLTTAALSLRNRISGKKAYDPSQQPFLLKLLRDPETLALLKSQEHKLSAMLDDQSTASSIVPYLFKMLKQNPLIKALEAKGLGSSYINEHLRPAVIEAIKNKLSLALKWGQKLVPQYLSSDLSKLACRAEATLTAACFVQAAYLH
jgi:hypothetical protein